VNFTGSDASPQLNSHFFRKLPLELRRQIYSEVLAGNELLFRVINEDTSLNGHEVGKEKISFELTCDAARGLLSFPMTCKLAYAHLSTQIGFWQQLTTCPGIWNRSVICTTAIRFDSLELQSTVVSSESCLSRTWI
jgi:hypothetical protein